MSQPSGLNYPFNEILKRSKIVFSPTIEEHFRDGQHAFERSQFEVARSSFDTALAEIDCHLRSVALLGRAMCREAQGNQKGAIIDAKNIVKLSPGWAEGYMYLGTLYTNQGEMAQALSTLQSGKQHANREDTK
ncbi:hypothetical protein BDA99DRAFT_132800 [Phascolomyces articulosus]|uniref:Uncharacterized protein n=1 Tax=Phascolomyces articulosus TaxID=60185 RepID=A0AAD5PBP5_9FUNG|nr:hypothetical protein BDA99DRAFT_132800 [Phascolomyces articulosus]